MSATLTTSISPPPYSSSKIPATTITREPEINTISTINELLTNRAETIPDAPLVAYPGTARGRADYVNYTAKDLDRFADEAAHKLTSLGLQPQNSLKAEVVALLAPSNLDYVTTIFALSRMGFAVLLLSNRLSTEAYVSLLQKTDCHSIVVSSNLSGTVEAIQESYSITSYPLLSQDSYDLRNTLVSRFRRKMPIRNEPIRVAFIIHSSGSTGLPKPIFQTHQACLSNYSTGSGFKAFLTLPLYHNHGLSTFFRAICSAKRIALFNANLPLSSNNLVESMEATRPESFHGVPYALKLLAESERGILALKNCKLVLFGGSSCPDDLGDKLVKAGVYLVGHYGATEMGQLMTSHRPPGDEAWNYVRPVPGVEPYLRMIPRTTDAYECVVLDGLPTKVVSNSSDPPNSFCTSDTFTPHPTIHNAWKYLGRLDDRVTLVNGEKVLPIHYEHQIRQSELVRDVLVFGVGRAFPGLLVVPSQKTTGMSKADVLAKLMPVIEDANLRVEKFSQISQKMVEILDAETDYPRTDKGTMIRAACYKKFADLIDSIYVRFDAQDERSDSNCLVLDLAGLESYILDVFNNKLGVKSLEAHTDFFEAGIDSLQAITARGYMMRELDLGSKVLEQNVVFDFPNAQSLARHLYSLRTGQKMEQKNDLDVMAELIQKYSSFPERVPGTQEVEGDVVILTGATGSLGAHILAQLVQLNHVKHVYCLVRASSKAAARDRVFSTLDAKKLSPVMDETKITCLPADLGRPDLGLEADILENLKSKLTTVVHSAWAVNFNLGVSSFEQQHIGGAYNLLNLCLSVHTVQPAKFYFCSSISVAAGAPLPAAIQETYISDLSYAQSMGYARSKLVTETIIKAAAEKTGMSARVLRVGQIVGDTDNGLWNPTEAIPLMIQSAVTIGALPALEETPSWLPVDHVARAVIELSGLCHTSPEITQELTDLSVVYHVNNPNVFHWTHDLLPALRNAGLKFETLPQREWVQRLRTSEPDPRKNPTIKLVDFFADKYDNDKPGRKGLVFVTEKTGQKSDVIREGYNVMGGDLIQKCVNSWKEMW